MKKTKKIITLALAMCLTLGMAGCGAAKDQGGNSTKDDGGVKPVILAVSFGTSYESTRDKTIGAIEKSLQETYPEYEVRRAFTSQIIIDKLKERDGIEVDNVKDAMERLVSDGVRDVIVQPTHIMEGFEYDDVVKEVNGYSDSFDSLVTGKPLLTDEEDYDKVTKALSEIMKVYDNSDTAIVFMGHGTEHESNAVYTKLQDKLKDAKMDNYFIGTVEATPSLEDVIAMVKASGAKKVVLHPLMVVAGDHANNDMAGDEDGSWKTEFEKAGFEVECVLNGLGQYESIQKIYTEHAGAAIEA